MTSPDEVNQALMAWSLYIFYLAGLMDIYQRILGLKFTKLDNPEVWHEDVEMYQVCCCGSHESLGAYGQ